MVISRSYADVPNTLRLMRVVSLDEIKDGLAIITGADAEGLAVCPSRVLGDLLCPNTEIGIECPLSHERPLCPDSFHVRAFCPRR